tara:strand:- start:172 stop:387 length:216 start_codon:yes stop_codon:yes gene_type:complete
MKKSLMILVMLCSVSLVYGAHHELNTSKIIEIAMSAAPSNVSEKAAIMGSDGSIFKRGKQWMDLHAWFSPK